MAVVVCVECEREDGDGDRGWEGYLVDPDDDGKDEVAFFCPEFAAREFGTRRAS
jgi:hypothetical protein